jgi:uncharacterized GH25 family protein
MISRHANWLIGLLVCTWIPLASAHDFWLQPSDYWIHSQALDSMTLQVGHGPFRQRSPIAARRIVRYEVITPLGAVVDLRGQLQLGEPTKDGDFRLEEPGTHMLVLQTDDRAQAHLPSIRFNDYLQAEGLTPALEMRKQQHRVDDDGSERYSRCAKAIVEVGLANAASHAQVLKPVGLPLEIVPEVNPYDVPRPSTLPVRIIYEGRPLVGALVKLTNLEHDASPFEVRLTDLVGRAVFAMPHSGTWLVNVIWTRPLPPSDEVDFETIFSSLTFGFHAVDP